MVLLAALLFGGCSTGLGGDAAGGRSDGGSGEASGTTVLSPRPSGPTTTVLVEDDPLGGYAPEPLSWSDCGQLQCATLVVPLDWSKPEGDTLNLAVSRRPSSGRSQGSVLVNPGGPGGSGVETVEWVFQEPAFDELNDRFDVVGWDPRGTNSSDSVSCDDSVDDFRALDPSPDDAAETKALNDTAQQITNDCETSSADLLPHVSTSDSVKDMDALRRALGENQMTYYGFSYGTALGSFYADEFPDRVRAIVLDGVVDPDADLEEFLTAQTQGFEDALDAIFASCGSSCPKGGTAKLYDRLAKRVESEPIGSGDLTLGPAELATAAISATYSPAEGPAFAEALTEAEDGDPSALLNLADRYYGGAEYTPYLAIECIDQAHPDGDKEWAEFVARLEKASPRLGGSIGNELLPCANWPVKPVEPRPFPKAVASNPILVVGNTGDAATPFAQAEAMAQNLDNAVLLTHEGTGHTSYGNPCVDEITAAYLVHLDVPEDGTVCRD